MFSGLTLYLLGQCIKFSKVWHVLLVMLQSCLCLYMLVLLKYVVLTFVCVFYQVCESERCVWSWFSSTFM